MAQATDVAAAASALHDALVRATPNGRDHYPLNNLPVAMAAHQARLRAAAAIVDDMARLADHIHECGDHRLS
jgi:hypothetical protein